MKVIVIGAGNAVLDGLVNALLSKLEGIEQAEVVNESVDFVIRPMPNLQENIRIEVRDRYRGKCKKLRRQARGW